jgi:superfamily I DNA/RNA helicase
MLGNGEKLNQEPRIEVSTIHAAKGGECENVIVVLDNAKKIRDSVENNIKKQMKNIEFGMLVLLELKKVYTY